MYRVICTVCIFLLLTSCGAGSPVIVAENSHLHARATLGIHVHPSTPAFIVSVEDAFTVSDTVRVQVDFQNNDLEVPRYILEASKVATRRDKTLIVILGVSTNMVVNDPEKWEYEAGLWFKWVLTQLLQSPSLGDIVFEIGNEPDIFCAGNQQMSYPPFVFPTCSMDEYLEYVRVVRESIEPIITARNLIADGKWSTMTAGTIPWHQSGRVQMNREVLESEHTKGMNFNLHIYDPRYSQISSLIELYETAKSQGREVWVTETGSTSRQLKFMTDTYSILAEFGIHFDRVVVYAYTDDTLGFSMVSFKTGLPVDSDLMSALRAREGSPGRF